MRLLSIFFFFTGMSLHCVTAGAQWVVTDPGNTAQGIINAANTASTCLLYTSFCVGKIAGVSFSI